MGKVWQEKIDGRWRSVKACDACGHVMRSARKSCPVCLHVERVVDSDPWSDGLAVVHVDDTGVARPIVPARVFDLGGVRPGRMVQTSRPIFPSATGPCSCGSAEYHPRALDCRIAADPVIGDRAMARAAGVEPEFTARHFWFGLGACAAIVSICYAWAVLCGWRG